MKKLKEQYRQKRQCRLVVSGREYIWDSYPSLRNQLFKKFSTKQERAYYTLHYKEYKDYPLKLRAARGNILADPWDDYPSSCSKLAKCWKNNSRRKHQFYR